MRLRQNRDYNWACDATEYLSHAKMLPNNWATRAVVIQYHGRHHFFHSSTTAHTANNSTHATPSTTATHVKPFTAAIMAAASKRRCRKRKQYIKAFTSDHIPIPDYDNHTRPVRCVCPPPRRGSISIIPIYFDMAITANRLSADS